MRAKMLFACVLVLICGVVPGGSLSAKDFRPLTEDQDNLIQKDGDRWGKAPVQFTRDGKAVTLTPQFLCSKGKGIVSVAGHDDFLKKPGPNGIFFLGLTDEKNQTGYTCSYYRLEEKDRKRYSVITGSKPGEELRYAYELDGKVLRLSGGEKIQIWAGLLDLSGEYTRTK